MNRRTKSATVTFHTSTGQPPNLLGSSHNDVSCAVVMGLLDFRQSSLAQAGGGSASQRYNSVPKLTKVALLHFLQGHGTRP